MEQKKYEVLDKCENVIASNMDIQMALIFIRALCEEFYGEKAYYILKEMKFKIENES